MIQGVLFVCFFISFAVTLVVTPGWIRRARKAGLVGRDLHKLDGRMVAEMGGVAVLVGFVIGVLVFVAINTFYLDAAHKNLQILGILSTILIMGMIGIIDDILGWKMGLRQWQKPLLTVFAAFPMMVINAGYSNIVVPYIGVVDLTYLYPLVVVPLAIVGASNGFNMIAGYNGLETGMGAIILFAMGFVAWYTGRGWVAVIALCMVCSLFAFWLFAKHPSRVFPGDTLTYSVGALIACVAIVGNMEKIALILFIPYFITLPLKWRGMMQKQSYGRLLPDGSLGMRYDKVYGIEHVVLLVWKKLFGKVYEEDVVSALYFVEGMLAFIVVVMVI